MPSSKLQKLKLLHQFCNYWKFNELHSQQFYGVWVIR